MIKQFKQSADHMRDKEYQKNHYQVAGFVDPLDKSSLSQQDAASLKVEQLPASAHDSFGRIGLLPHVIMGLQSKDGSSFLDNEDVNQAVILGESNCPDDDLKNTSFFAQDLKAD